MKKAVIKSLIQQFGGGFAGALEIKLANDAETEIFKWFLASFLYGARISESIASRTYRQFEKQQVLTPQRIQDKGWDALVQILDDGGYVRYDFSTATKLLAVNGDLITYYGGQINKVHEAAKNPRDLEERLQHIGKGIGPVTVNIFLRELRGIWPKAEPLPSDIVILSARCLGLLDKKVQNRKRMLELLKEQWKNTNVEGSTFVDFEAALVRLGLRHCRKEKHLTCPMAPYCLAGLKETST